jgi:hypothetical protein
MQDPYEPTLSEVIKLLILERLKVQADYAALPRDEWLSQSGRAIANREHELYTALVVLRVMSAKATQTRPAGQQQTESEPAKPAQGLFFNGSQIRMPLNAHTGISPDAPGSALVASIHTPAAVLGLAELSATGRAMAAAGEMLQALQVVAAKLGSRPYGTGSYLPKAIREMVTTAIAKATREEA